MRRLALVFTEYARIRLAGLALSAGVRVSLWLMPQPAPAPVYVGPWGRSDGN